MSEARHMCSESSGACRPRTGAQPEFLPHEDLVLWEPDDPDDEGKKPVIVPAVLAQYLRQHQREGVQFMFECGAYLA